MYQKKELIHSLSFLSNAAYDIKAKSFNDLQTQTFNIVKTCLDDSGIKADIGDWTQVWGPVVFSNNPTSKTVVADNTMMLVYNQSQNLFVVGIAGTNVVSTYGFLQEDFKVNTMVKWSEVVNKDIDGSGRIAEGTNIGLNILLAMKGGELTVNNMPVVDMITALQDYIKTNSISGAEVAVTGHSLGGALAPVMAMYLQDTASVWNTKDNIKTISAWPTAGPTPGNLDFATYVGTQMKGQYNSYYNPLDVIPQAWQGDTLKLIPGIYKDGIQAPETTAPYNTPVGTLVVGALLNTVNATINPLNPIQYTQVQPWNKLSGATFNSDIEKLLYLYFKGMEFYTDTSSLKDYLPYLKFLSLFLKQMLYQHTKAYNSLLDIEDFMTKYGVIKNDIVGTTEEERDEDAFYSAMNKYYNMPDLRQVSEQALRPEA